MMKKSVVFSLTSFGAWKNDSVMNTKKVLRVRCIMNSSVTTE